MIKLNLKTIVIVALMSIPLICIAIILGLSAVFPSTDEDWVITDLSQYSEIRNGHNQGLIKHFPEQIPKSAAKVSFFYSPPFLQKGLVIQLRLKLPINEIRRLQIEYDELISRKGNRKTYLTSSYPLGVYTKDKPEGEMLPQGYKIVVLEAETKNQGNHGHAYGVAINDSTSEILYWAEAW